MKIYFELKNYHGRAMMRIQNAIKKYAPKDIEFTNNLELADVQFLHLIGTGELNELKKSKYVIFPYCFEPLNIPLIERAQKYFKEAIMVFSYLDIENIIKSSNMNFLRSPLGVDIEIFKKTAPEYKDVIVTTTGYVAGSEGIDACIAAAFTLKKWAIHVGGDISGELGFNPSERYAGFYHRKENISDDELVSCYNRSHFVSGLRIFEGFEFPVLEGLLCGARPICFDIDCYKHWFKDLPIYVPQCTGHELSIRLLDIFYNPKPVSNEEIEYVKSVFSWEVVAKNFWNYFLDHV
jgi:glycosyltransferase involved in cell wall biosynthesis